MLGQAIGHKKAGSIFVSSYIALESKMHPLQPLGVLRRSFLKMAFITVGFEFSILTVMASKLLFQLGRIGLL